MFLYFFLFFNFIFFLFLFESYISLFFFFFSFNENFLLIFFVFFISYLIVFFFFSSMYLYLDQLSLKKYLVYLASGRICIERLKAIILDLEKYLNRATDYNLFVRFFFSRLFLYNLLTNVLFFSFAVLESNCIVESSFNKAYSGIRGISYSLAN